MQDIIDTFGSGGFVIITDSPDRENEADLVLAAEHITPEKMAFVIRHTGGVVCLALSETIADQLALPEMVRKNTAARGTNFTVSIEASSGISTGISAADRATTIRAAVARDAKPEDLNRPGHVFPLRAKRGGVLWRSGHTEASVDLCTIAGQRQGAVISELMRDDGTMMRGELLHEFASEHDIPIVSVADIIAHRYETEQFIRLDATTTLQTKTGPWHMRVYRDLLHEIDHVALLYGNISQDEPTLVRVHSSCMTGDVFGSLHCDCAQQRDVAMQAITQHGSGVFLYMQQEGRGIGLSNKIKAYQLQRTHDLNTYEANKALGLPEDLREYGVGAQILAHCGATEIRLMTNNPKKMSGIEGYGITILEQIPIAIEPNGVNNSYIKAKQDYGHAFGV
jgi:3,4-dihydroxy 2-butanone 4-phosphate synthase / GTP cyclohydrolase II